jgi:PAS domain S-box-containing protein
MNNNKTDETQVRRGRILEALSIAAEYFLRATPDVWEKNVVEVLKKLGEARDSGRVIIGKNTYRDGRVLVQTRYEWKASGEIKIFDEDDFSQKEYSEAGLARWVEILKNGQAICELVEQLPQEEKKWNLAPDAKSIVVVPVFVGDEWWGFLEFEDWNHESDCSKFEIDALKAVAITFGEAIKRKRIEEELEEEKASVELRVLERTQELQEEKARLTASIHSMSLGFVMTNLKGEVVLFNHAVTNIFGAIDGYWTLDLLQEKLGTVLNLREYVDRSIAEVKEFHLNEVSYHEQTLMINLTPIRMVEGDGRVIGVVILVEDITDEKNLQRSRDEFFAVAAHELRTPLTAIRGYAQMIGHYYPEAVANEKVKEMLTDIDQSSSRLLELVSEYLDASRVELQKVTVKPESFDVVAVVRKAMDDLALTAREKKLVWELQIPEGVDIRVTADPGRTAQIVINLLGNAIKNTATGGVYVKVVSEGGRVRVFVYDTGVGIKPEEQPFLFQKFKQLGDRVYARDVTTGTGMGLYISRLLAEAMGGRVYLEKSNPGEGSGFVMELPAG